MMPIRSLVVGTLLASATTAEAADPGFRTAQSVGIAGTVAGFTGPVVAGVGGGFLIGGGLNSAITGDGSGDVAVAAGASVFTVGQAAVSLGPPLAVGGTLAAAGHLRRMGAAPPTLAGWIGLGGVAMQFTGIGLGIGWTVAKGELGVYPPYLLRTAGWTTAMVGACVQLSHNTRTHRSIEKVARHRVTVGLVPAPNGVGLAGRF